MIIVFRPRSTIPRTTIHESRSTNHDPRTTNHDPRRSRSTNILMPVTTQVRVRYAETDQMGIVYYANYLVWFEMGRVELLRSARPRLQQSSKRITAHSAGD